MKRYYVKKMYCILSYCHIVLQYKPTLLERFLLTGTCIPTISVFVKSIHPSYFLFRRISGEGKFVAKVFLLGLRKSNTYKKNSNSPNGFFM